MVEIHLYGKLRGYARDQFPGGEYTPARDIVLSLENGTDETVASLLGRAGIPVQEINHIFYNSKLLATRSPTAMLFDLPQAMEQVTGWDLAVKVEDGDRLGLFGTDIPFLSM